MTRLMTRSGRIPWIVVVALGGILFPSTTEAQFVRPLLDGTRNSLTDWAPPSRFESPYLESPTLDDSVRTEQPSYGYKVQIARTRQVMEADSILQEYLVWSDTLFTEHRPKGYLDFRTPYYRVSVGNFTEQRVAIYFAETIRRQFPDAWVVQGELDTQRLAPEGTQWITDPDTTAVSDVESKQ
ncbi:MAG: SPOR domain-containing protein [Balneolaceae bacterium]|nr:SPOR domain-containing protein [Balneolaceae bacterium]